MPSGWYELNLDGTENLLWEYHDPNWVDDGWGDEPSFPFTTGYYKDDRVIGFHGEMLMYWLLWGHGSFTLDGDILEYQQYGDDLSVTDFSTYVVSCVYDAEEDRTYAYTLNPEATGYMLQTVDTDSWSFTPILTDVPIENVCVGLAYNPDDCAVYGYTPDSRFVKFNGESGELTTLAKMNFPVSTSLHGMVYSPLDKGFVFVFSDTDGASLYFIEPGGQATFLSDLPEAMQYTILVTPDRMMDPRTPVTPVVNGLNFNGGALQGTASVTMPAKTFGDQSLSGTMTLLTYVDGLLVQETPADAGQTVEVSLSGLEEGNHRFAFSAKSGELESAKVESKRYIGFDTPVTPADIELSEGNLTWSAVTEGVNGGYIDTDALTYNVYLNGEKINDAPITGTSYTFTMPQEVYRKYVAQVEAVNHDHVSDRGFSNDIKAGQSFPLPFQMQPTVAEGELIQVFSERGGWYEWRVSTDPTDPFLYCSLSTYDDPQEEWFILPAVNVGNSDRLLEVSFDVLIQEGYGDTVDENISVAFGNERNPQAMSTFKTWNGLDNTEEWQRLTAYCLPPAGDNYFGFMARTHEEGGDVKIRNIRIAVSDRSSMTPSEVTELTAGALPQGELKARVDFRMPEVSAAGLSLQGQTLTATISSDVETVSVSGNPGSEQSVEVKTLQGWNTITVTVSNGNTGLDSSVKVFTGMDVPRPLDAINIGHSTDYKSLLLAWNAPVVGFNGGYIDPAEVSYSLYRYNEDTYEWELSQDLGNVTEFDFTPESGEGLGIAGGAILTSNQQGDCGTVLTFEAPAGTPYTLPMIEDFNNEEIWGPTFEPCVLERPDDSYTAEWGFISAAYPYHVAERTPYGDGAFCVFAEDGEKARVALPVFSTVGVDSAAVELPVWCGPEAASIQVYAEAYGMAPELIGTFSAPETSTWIKHRFHLPAQFMGKEWVSIKVDAIFNEGNTIGAFADYRIKTFTRNDIGVVGMTCPDFSVAGEAMTVTAKIENMGIEAVATPAMELEVYNGCGLLATVPMTAVDTRKTLQELEQMQYTANWTPDGNACGELTLKVVCTARDMDQENNSASAGCVVTKGNQPVVTDLTVDVNGGNIELNWTEPAIEKGKEGFENFTSFYFGDRIGDFKNINADGYGTTYFAAFRFPYDDTSKGWQVIGEKEMTDLMSSAEMQNDYLHASTGNNVIAAFAPLSFIVGEEMEAEKWLISPMLQAGSEFSFMLTAGWSGTQENVEVLYSTTDDDPESFVSLDEILLLSPAWKSYSYTLPEDARYFAIVYRGKTDSQGFFVMVDDIAYKPVDQGCEIVGYDIVRDGMNIGENVDAKGSWTDRYELPQGGAVYNVVPVLEREGVISRGVKSNDAVADSSGIEDIATDGFRVNVGKGYISVTGADGRAITVNSVDGVNMAVIPSAASQEMVRLASGVYVVRIDGRSCRVLVK